MRDSRELTEQAAREIAASQRTSATPHGHNETGAATRAPEQRLPDTAHIEAINQVFALFRLNYHNQYYAAFPDAEQLRQIKKLWLDSLGEYPVEQILRGARHAIEHSEYLPTLHRMRECCELGLTALGLPSPRDAFLEACQAGSPKAAQPWSHAAVYVAGRDSDWFFLANNPEQATWPVFRDRYRQACQRVLRGENLAMPPAEALEQQPSRPLSRDEQLTALHRLRETTGL